MVKKLEPGERFNRYQAKKKPREKVVDPMVKKENVQIAKVAKQLSERKVLAIKGLV